MTLEEIEERINQGMIPFDEAKRLKDILTDRLAECEDILQDFELGFHVHQEYRGLAKKCQVLMNKL